MRPEATPVSRAPGLALLGGLALTVCVIVILDAFERDAARARFEWRAQAHAVSIQRAVDADTVMVDAVVGLFDASERVDRDEFSAFAMEVMKSRGDVPAIGWAPLVAEGARAEHEAAAGAEGIAGYQVKARDPAGTPIPAPAADLHAPVFFVVPTEGNLPVLGYDLLSEPIRRATLELSLLTGSTAATPPLPLVDLPPGRKGVLITHVVFRHGAPVETAAERRAAAMGWVIGVVDLAPLVERALADVTGGDLMVWVRTDDEAAPAVLSAETTDGVVRVGPLDEPAPDGLVAEFPLELPQRRLVLCFRPRPGTADPERLAVALLAGSGTLMSVALAAWLRSAALREQEERRRAADLEERVQERTAELSATAARLHAESRERERAELAERSSRMRATALLERLPGALWTADTGLAVTSRAGARLADFRLDGDEAITLAERWAGQAGLAAVFEAHRRATTEGTSDLVEVELDGVHYEVRVQAVRDPVVGGTVAVALDVTERRRHEAERREAELLRGQKLESLGVLAGGIAHDFNNLLVGVLGNVGLLASALPTSGPERAAAERIERAAHQAAVLTRQMLAYSGRGHFVVGPTDLGVVTRDLAELLSASISKKVELRFDFAADAAHVEADAAQVGQLVMNLVTNAADAIGADAGRIDVRTYTETLDAARLSRTQLGVGLEPGPYVALEVSDTGCGMDDATRQRMFDPFFTTKERGHGLGLSAALGILRGHRATVEVESRPGLGTRIRVWFPAGTAAVPQAAPVVPTAPSRARSLRVLVIDDEEAVRDFVVEALRRGGDTAIGTTDGRSGLAAFAEDPGAFDLVVLDLTMPEMDGRETFRELVRLRPEVRVLVSSGYAEGETMADFQDGGAVGFLQKPFTLRELRRAVDRVVS